jgi:CBS domain-containing protein
MLRQVVVKEAMSAEIHTTGPEASIAEAARIMIERKVGCLPVVEGEKLIGIVTESDFVRLVAQGKGVTG